MEIGCTEGQGCNGATAQSLRELRLAAFCRRGAGARTTLTVTKQVVIARRERRARQERVLCLHSTGGAGQGNSLL